MTVLGEGIPEESHDVLVLGTGMAGLCSAIAVCEYGSEALVIEIAPEAGKGGNTRYAGGIIRHPILPLYTQDDFLNDLMATSQGRADYDLVQQIVRSIEADITWLEGLGVKWETSLGYGKTRGKGRYVLGGGEGLIDALVKAAVRKGVKIQYDVRPFELLIDKQGHVSGVQALTQTGVRNFRAKAVILATGGFEANPEMRTRYIGRVADELIVRGTRYNLGGGLELALRAGAQAFGQWGDFHSAVIDARSKAIEAGETNVNTYPYTVLVNMNGERFVDEGEDTHDMTYVKTGKRILDQPFARAFCIFDSKIKGLMATGRQHLFNPIGADNLDELANRLGIDSFRLKATIASFNSSIQPGEFDPLRLDGKHTEGIQPPKSNWALPIDTPPFFAFPVTGGITFTFGGLKTDKEAQVLDSGGRPIVGLYAAGNVVGGFFYYNYPSGSALARALVFGKIAGANAARLAKGKDSAASPQG